MKTLLRFIGEVDNNGYLGDIHLEQIQTLDHTSPFNIIKKKDFTPSIGDKFYFLPGVNIPRVKMKDFTTEYNVKVVRDIREATVVFGSKLSAKKVLTTEWIYTVGTAEFTKCFEALVELKKLDDQTIERIKTALEFYTEDKIISNYRSIAMMGDVNLYSSLIVNPAYEFNNSKESKYVNEVEPDYLEIVKFMDGKEVLDESCILDLLNGDDAVLINKEVYGQLAVMLESSDADNHVVAMEIMANCKYKESLFYILKLMSLYNRQMINCRSVSHVNFKSLLSYLGIDKHNMAFTSDKRIAKLMEKGVLTPGMITSIIREDFNDPSSFYSSMVQVKTFTVSEEIHKYFNKNYTFELLPDFEPVPETQPEPVVQPTQNQTTWL